MSHFCIRINEFGIKGVGRGLALCRSPARKVTWVWKCGFWSESYLFLFLDRFRVKPYLSKQKTGVEILPLKDSSAWACLLGKNGAFLETLKTRFLAIT